MNQTVTHLADFDVSTKCRATVVSSRRITPESSPDEVREIVLDVERTDFPYGVGQSIAVLAPGAKEFGQEHHVRLYSVADLPERNEEGQPRIRICVKRCSYIDEYSGEEYKGVASNYLCDLAPGAHLTVAGPYGIVFDVPAEVDSTLILIGTGTGIAPFRAFVKHLYRNRPDWQGRVWLFYGARSGLELLYMNDETDDFTQYYDRETFEAFRALSPRPHWSDPIAWDHVIAQRSDELWDMLASPRTHVYVAGLEPMREELDKVFASVAGSPEAWQRRKAELMAGGRWVELLY